MINLLAIETSGAVCSVGLALDGNRFVRSEHVAKKHNERLLPMLDELCIEAGVQRSQLLESLQAVAFGRGPGSFTGVRIAAAAAQAIALAAAAQVVRVSSSAALALAALQRLDAPGVVTAIRSRRDLYYLAAYERDAGTVRVRQADALHEAEPDQAGGLEAWPLVGERPPWWSGDHAETPPADAGTLLELARAMVADGQAVDAAAGLPEYFTGDSPWRKSG